MEDHEAELAPEPELSETRRVRQPESGEIGDRRWNRRAFRGDLVPLEHGLAERDARAWHDELLAVLVVGPDAVPFEHVHPSSSARVKSITQFVSQVLPPSSENACSHRGVGVVTPDQMKRTRIGRPLKMSSPSNNPPSPAHPPITGGSSSPGRRL